MDFLPAFLSRDDKKALRCVSRATSDDPRSLQERLLAMTRRVGAVWLRRIAMEQELDFDHGTLDRLSSAVWLEECFVKGQRRQWRRIVRANNLEDAMEDTALDQV